MNKETSNAIKSSLNKKIIKINQDGDFIDDTLNIYFEDGSILSLWDDGQTCCESRYMTTDDNLADFYDCILTNIELKDCDYYEEEDKIWIHECQFLEITTDKGSFQIVNHNEHNGYYGGFSLQAEIKGAKE
jgi:hypothetical protein